MVSDGAAREGRWDEDLPTELIGGPPGRPALSFRWCAGQVHALL